VSRRISPGLKSFEAPRDFLSLMILNEVLVRNLSPPHSTGVAGPGIAFDALELELDKFVPPTPGSDLFSGFFHGQAHVIIH
jgi:hypothetical protein